MSAPYLRMRCQAALLGCSQRSICFFPFHSSSASEAPYTGTVILDLTDDEAHALARHLRDALYYARYPFAPRLDPLQRLIEPPSRHQDVGLVPQATLERRPVVQSTGGLLLGGEGRQGAGRAPQTGEQPALVAQAIAQASEVADLAVDDRPPLGEPLGADRVAAFLEQSSALTQQVGEAVTRGVGPGNELLRDADRVCRRRLE